MRSGACEGREDISEQLDIEPIRFFVHRHIRPQYACRACETMTAAPIAAAVIDGGLATPGLLSWVVTSKYLDHLPLYRLEEIAARQGVKLARSSLADWVGRVGVALQPLADRLAELLRQRLVLHADETPVAQLAPGTGKTKCAYLWAYRSGEFDEGPPIVVFDYQTSREGSHVRDFLPDWKGHLVVDDYSGYKASFKKGVTEVGCNAHARRKFFDLHAANQSSIAGQALFYIAELYEIEKRAKSLNVAQREELRLKETVPKLKAYHNWLILTRTTVADGSSTARAIDYSLKRWESLSLFASTGLLPIGRVEMWRGGSRQCISVSAPFVWRCLTNIAIAPFPHPARRTGRADFPHPALFQPIKPSHSHGRRCAAEGISVPAFRIGTGRNTGDIPFLSCRAYASTRSANGAQRKHRSVGRPAPPDLG